MVTMTPTLQTPGVFSLLDPNSTANSSSKEEIYKLREEEFIHASWFFICYFIFYAVYMFSMMKYVNKNYRITTALRSCNETKDENGQLVQILPPKYTTS